MHCYSLLGNVMGFTKHPQNEQQRFLVEKRVAEN